jgi:hypothetical protein
VVVDARRAAIQLLDGDPDLTSHGELADELALLSEDSDEDFLLKG